MANAWLYFGYGIITAVAILIIIAVFVGIFVCIDNYFEKRGDNDC